MAKFITLKIIIKHSQKSGNNVTNWIPLEFKSEEYKFLWNFVYENLFFEPYAKPHHLAVLPEPKKFFDTSKFMGSSFSEPLYNELHEVTQNWFKKICDGKRMYALDWQHECYSFDPYLPFEKGQVFDKWPIPVFPNGDYYFFLTHDFKNGIFCDGLHFELAIWGQRIVDAYKDQTPVMLRAELPIPRRLPT